MLSLETVRGYAAILVQSVLYALVNAQWKSGSRGAVVMKESGCFPGE